MATQAKIPGTKAVAAIASKPSPKAVADTFTDADALFFGEPVPAGKYSLLVNARVERDKNGQPFVLAKNTVVEGPFKGRTVTARMYLAHEREDGSPNQSLNITLGLLVNMTGGIPESVKAVGKSNKDKLAAAIVESIQGAEFEGNVVQRTYNNGTEDVVTNDLRATKPKGWAK